MRADCLIEVLLSLCSLGAWKRRWLESRGIQRSRAIGFARASMSVDIDWQCNLTNQCDETHLERLFFPSIRDKQELTVLSSACCRVVMLYGSVFYALQCGTSFSLLAIEQLSIITQLIWYSHGRAYQKRKLCVLYFVQVVC